MGGKLTKGNELYYNTTDMFKIIELLKRCQSTLKVFISALVWTCVFVWAFLWIHFQANTTNHKAGATPRIVEALANADTTQAPRSDQEQLIIDTYRKVNPSVVFVSTRVDVIDFFGAHYQEGSGSGVIIDAPNGYVVTNYHVIANAAQIMVTLASGQSHSVKLVGLDPGNDLALLQLEELPEGLVAAELGNSDALEVGQTVLAIGNPFGLNRTLSRGIVSSLGRTIRAEDGRLIEDIVQIDAAINPGNSGGPLLDTAGRVVGLNTAILSRVGESAGIGFAIPVNQIRSAVPQLIKYGRVLRPKIGVVFADTEYGPVLLYVKPDSPAAEAGLQGARRKVHRGAFVGIAMDFARADFVLAINGKPVRLKSELVDEISKAEAGKEISFTVRRGLSRSAKVRGVTVTPELG